MVRRCIAQDNHKLTAETTIDQHFWVETHSACEGHWLTNKHLFSGESSLFRVWWGEKMTDESTREIVVSDTFQLSSDGEWENLWLDYVDSDKSDCLCSLQIHLDFQNKNLVQRILDEALQLLLQAFGSQFCCIRVCKTSEFLNILRQRQKKAEAFRKARKLTAM